MSLIGYLKDVRAEMVHISWPTRETVIQHTMLVIGIALLVGIALGMLDNGFSKTLSLFIGGR